MATLTPEMAQKFVGIAQRAWKDDAFKGRVLREPKKVFAEEKLPVPQQVTVHEDTPNSWNYIIPQQADYAAMNMPLINPYVARVMERAYRDPAFKQQLLSKPKETIEEETGVKLPASATIHVWEDTPTHQHLVLPANPAALAKAELSDAELEQVAGGKGGSGHVCGTVGQVGGIAQQAGGIAGRLPGVGGLVGAAAGLGGMAIQLGASIGSSITHK